MNHVLCFPHCHCFGCHCYCNCLVLLLLLVSMLLLVLWIVGNMNFNNEKNCWFAIFDIQLFYHNNNELIYQLHAIQILCPDNSISDELNALFLKHHSSSFASPHAGYKLLHKQAIYQSQSFFAIYLRAHFTFDVSLRNTFLFMIWFVLSNHFL